MKTTERISTWKNILYILAGLGGISLIILIHEMGHFLFAKLFNVPTPVFSLGFGPTLFSLPIGTTTFQIALFPMGGYVEIDLEILAQQAYIPKMLIIFGGILFNLIFAYIVLLFYTMRNRYTLLPIVDRVIPHSPAAKAGLLPHDTIIAYNQEPIEKHLRTISNAIPVSEDTTITLSIQRDGTTHEIPVLLDAEHPLFGSSARWLGIELEKSSTKNSSVSSHIQDGHKKITAITQEMSHAVTTMATKKDHKNMIIGPIGIINMIGKSLAIKPELYWFILAIVSLNIGLFNILPLPFFDGGKALLFTIEALTGTTIPAHIMWVISMIALVVFILFIATITMNDVKRLWKK